MKEESLKAVQDADAEVLAVLIRLAMNHHSKLAIQEEFSKAHQSVSITTHQDYSIPFGKRLTEIQRRAGLV